MNVNEVQKELSQSLLNEVKYSNKELQNVDVIGLVQVSQSLLNEVKYSNWAKHMFCLFFRQMGRNPF